MTELDRWPQDEGPERATLDEEEVRQWHQDDKLLTDDEVKLAVKSLREIREKIRQDSIETEDRLQGRKLQQGEDNE